jgi:hypothetical protein
MWEDENAGGRECGKTRIWEQGKWGVETPAMTRVRGGKGTVLYWQSKNWMTQVAGWRGEKAGKT